METNSRVIIAPEVIKDIVSESLNEINGVYSIFEKEKNYVDLAKSFINQVVETNKQYPQTLEVEVGDGECVVDISLVLKYGYKIYDVVKEVEDIIVKNIKEYVGYEVKELNIKVAKLVNMNKVTGEDNEDNN